jgi:DNA-binding MarR family transcriptional regulator
VTVVDGRESKAARNGRLAHLNVLIAADRFRDELEAKCKTEGVTLAQYAVLWTLCLTDAPDGLPTGALADGLVTRQPDITRLVDKLVQAGFVTRTAAEHYRRVVMVAATDAGRAVFDRLSPQFIAFHEQQWSNLSAAELRQFSDLLAKALWGNA